MLEVLEAPQMPPVSVLMMLICGLAQQEEQQMQAAQQEVESAAESFSSAPPAPQQSGADSTQSQVPSVHQNLWKDTMEGVEVAGEKTQEAQGPQHSATPQVLHPTPGFVPELSDALLEELQAAVEQGYRQQQQTQVPAEDLVWPEPAVQQASASSWLHSLRQLPVRQ